MVYASHGLIQNASIYDTLKGFSSQRNGMERFEILDQGRSKHEIIQQIVVIKVVGSSSRGLRDGRELLGVDGSA